MKLSKKMCFQFRFKAGKTSTISEFKRELTQKL